MNATNPDGKARFRAALRERIEHDLRRGHLRRRRRRLLVLASACVAASALLVVALPFGRSESAIARARAALTLPTTGILHVTSRDARDHMFREIWQSLSNPNEHLSYEDYGSTRGGHHETAIANGIWMRYVPGADTIYTQRVIEAVGRTSELGGGPDIRGLLQQPQARDRGIVDRGGQALYEIELPGAQGTPGSSCSYLVDPATFVPVRLDCSNGGHQTFSTRWEIVADTPENRANFSLTTAHPDATLRQDPNGIPGRAGTDLAAVKHDGIEDATSGRDDLQRTDEPAMRAARVTEIAVNARFTACLDEHAGPRVPIADEPGAFTWNDPTGTVGAICQHHETGRNAIENTPAGAALQAREVRHNLRIGRCADRLLASGTDRTDAQETCTNENPDGFLDSLPTYPQ